MSQPPKTYGRTGPSGTTQVHERMLAPSRILRTTPRQIGGGRSREDLVAEAQRAIAEGSKSFRWASLLFDRPTRERAWMLYAWCRRCDDIADGQAFGRPQHDRAHDEPRDEAPDAEEVHDLIAAIRILTRRALDGQPTADPAFDAFGQVALEARLTMAMAEDVIEGFALDAEDWRPRTEEDLIRYCWHVAGAVGVMMAQVMGVSPDDHETLDRAADLGMAFQLVNIARDLLEDDAMGRCYLPEEWLSEQDIEPGQHVKPHHREELAEMAARLVALSQQHEAAGRWGAGRLGFRQRWAVLAAANIYGAIGTQVVELGAHAWDHRVYVTKLAKAGLTAKALGQALRKAPRPAEMPRWSRGEILLKLRMQGDPAPMPMTPLPDEDVE
jgi:phytoene synthase